MLEQIDHPPDTPRRILILGREEANRHIPRRQKIEPQNNEGKEKVGNRQPDKADQAKEIIQCRILIGRRVKPNGDADRIDQHKGK